VNGTTTSKTEDGTRTEMADYDNIFLQLAEDFGIARILEQNDIEEWIVADMLYRSGHLDLDDYIFTELDVSDED